jgi:all-trans-retinol 13,14-reductase
MKYDWVIIGAGVSGMVSAIILAKSGYRTAIVEKAPEPARTIRGFSRNGKFFDTGFHYAGGLEDKGPLDVILKYLGLSESLEKVPFDPDGFDILRIREPSFEFSFPFGLEALRQRLLGDFPGEKGAIDGYLSIITRACQRLPYMDLESEMPENLLPFSVHEPTLQQVLDGLTSNTLLKCVLSAHCLLHGVSPCEVPITNHASVVVPYYRSSHAIMGGGASLARFFEERLGDLGTDIYCGRGATGLAWAGDRSISGVCLENGETIPCGGVVCTVHPSYLVDILPEWAFRPALRDHLKTLEDTSSAISLFGTCKKPAETLSRSNIFHMPSALYPAVASNTNIEQNPLFISGGPRRNDKSEAGVIVISPYPNTRDRAFRAQGLPAGRQQYDRWKGEATRRLMAHVENSIPELHKNMEIVESATPFTFMGFTNNPTGGLYGVKHKSGQYNPMPMTKIDKVFVAGQAVTAPGILGAAISGFVASGCIVGHEKLRKELRAYI